MDPERAYKDEDNEREALLAPNHIRPKELGSDSFWSRSSFSLLHIAIAFVAGILACFVGQYLVCGATCSQSYSPISSLSNNIAPGSTEVHHFPPTKPTNAFPSLFPSDVGYAGITPTGAEPAVIATAPAYPMNTGASPLIPPTSFGQGKNKNKPSFNIFRKWGNLSPWYSVDRGTFGIDSGPEAPDQCQITALHLLHRHGARYPTAWSAYAPPAQFAHKLHEAAGNWSASGNLAFLNNWTYKLGEEVLTAFGRKQLFDLGVSTRLKYGYLLKNFTETNTIPVFRTESEDRMLNSALNFAVGFFGYPLDGQYQQSITIEASGFNNTLAPYETCRNARIAEKSERGKYYVEKWAAVYLKDAQERLQSQLSGFKLDIESVYTFQMLCAYETVALGYSKFCELFTEDEWDGFDYSLDLSFWYNSAFGSPVARVQGAGYVQELLARLTHTPIENHVFSTNSTLDDNPITFPLNQSLYVDATHEVVVLNVLTALNLSTLAASGPLPADHIPKHRPFVVSQLAPFATNVQFQLLECSNLSGQQIRAVVNDGVLPLTGISGCPKQKDGLCPVDSFVKAQKALLSKVDWTHDCLGNWTVPEGPAWETVTGDAPR